MDLIEDPVARDLGWAPVREIPVEFSAQVERAEGAALEYHRGGVLDALDEQMLIWEEVLGHPKFATAPMTFRLDAFNRGGLAGLFSYERTAQEASLRSAESCWVR